MADQYRFPSFFSAIGLIAWLFVTISGLHGQSLLPESYKSATLSGSTIVALDPSNDIYTSDDDGASFTLRQDTSDLFGGTNENFTEIEGLGSTVIAVGVDGLTLRSNDGGMTWALANSPTTFDTLNGVAGRTNSPNPNEWISVGDDFFDGVILRSQDDGLNWSLAETITNVSLADVIWTGTRWLACGADDSFAGIVYSSTDGVNWTASTLPTSQPLLAMAADGSGVVLAVGESGQILRSTDDGLNFSEIAIQYQGGVNLNAVALDSSGAFVIGGEERLLIEIDGTTATTLEDNIPDAEPVLDLILIDGVVTAIGEFAGLSVRSQPLTLSIAPGGSLDFVLSVNETLTGSSYVLETTTDLADGIWSQVPGTSTSGNGGSLSFEVSRDNPKRFWRVVEL